MAAGFTYLLTTLFVMFIKLYIYSILVKSILNNYVRALKRAFGIFVIFFISSFIFESDDHYVNISVLLTPNCVWGGEGGTN